MPQKQKKKRKKHLDDLSRAILNQLAKHDGYGFSYDVLAALAFRKSVSKVTKNEAASVAGYFYRNGAHISDWRHGLTAESWQFATQKAQIRARKRLKVA